ncbi:MAG: hypothetical protein NC489_19390 [Ruminococcus flavefaciens]|nr:hypothetical protein [Ruminococcus flavefaciens]
MGSVIYKIKDYSREYLQKHKFRYSSYMSNYDDEIYTYKFPLITYKATTTIECEIAVSTTTGIANINVYNSGTKDLYAPYYNREFGTYEIIKSIDKKIDNKLIELGITKL